MTTHSETYNPDVLTCLANLSNDEVFTPPTLANDMLDQLPEELWNNPEAKFLDPACKSGVFLREIAKRLMDGLEDKIPNTQDRINHIYTKQLYGISITELTGLLARRSLYCSKYANGKYSIVQGFDTENGNIDYTRSEHKWFNDKCVLCGASQLEYDRSDDLETHAYKFIHINKPEELYDMQFDVIIGNPPYQLSTGSSSAQATPLYNKFVEQAKKLNPRYLTMIIPGRWYAGGMGLDQFRSNMLGDTRIRKLVDYPNAGEVFPGIALRGGACYFLWDRDNPGDCEFTSISNNVSNTTRRILNEYPVFIRWNQALNIIKKINTKDNDSLSKLISGVSPFGLSTSVRGAEKKSEGYLTLHSSNGVSFIARQTVPSGKELIDKYKVLLTRPISGNMEVPPFKIIATLKTLRPQEICTHTYLIAGEYDNELESINLQKYLSTRFVRFLLAQSISGMDISRDKFRFVPTQDFTQEWTDKKLYIKYNISPEEIEFIETMIRPMELN